MKKKSRTTTVYRINLEKGKYTTISRSILISPNLRDSSKTLIQLLLNNTNDWVLVLSFYQKLLGWSNDKMTGAVADLIENGYLKKNKFSRGKDKGFYYTYIVSEFGNLNPDKEQPNEEEILASIEDEQTEIEPTNENSIPAESNQEQPQVKESQVEVPEASVQSEIKPTFQHDKVFFDRVLMILSEELKCTQDKEFLKKAVDYYLTKVETGELTNENFDEEKTRKTLKDRVAKVFESMMIVITNWIDLYNDRGTKDQRANMKARAILYFKEQLELGAEVTEADVKLKLLKLKVSVVDVNRVHDSRSQD